MDALMGTRASPNEGINHEELMASFHHELDDRSHISLRLKPTLGRYVDGLAGDPGKGFRILESKCSANGVKMQERMQKTYVRKGQRRKQLRRQRWRAVFKGGFIAECDRIRRMRKQGW